MTAEYRLVIKLDKYAGNVDELVCTALTGTGEGRYGHEEALTVYQQRVVPFLNGEKDLPTGFCTLETEYGGRCYKLDDLDNNSLQLGVDSYSVGYLRECIELWKKAYGDPVKIVVNMPSYASEGGTEEVVVNVLGFQLITIKHEREEL